MIQEKLLAIQIALKAPKGNRNTYGNYNYRSCEDILEAVKPILNEVNCTLKISDELMNIGDRYYIKAVASESDKKRYICRILKIYCRNNKRHGKCSNGCSRHPVEA